MTTSTILAPVHQRSGRLWRIVRLFLAVAVFFVVAVAAILVLLAAHNPDIAFDAEAAKGIAYTPFASLAPGPGLPEDISLLRANNCLDSAKFGGRYYLAFRTAPYHFASDKARIIVISSEDNRQWRKESEFTLASDLREPRLMAFNGKLMLYFFQGGTRMLRFEPRHIYATERLADGAWAEPRKVYKPGYVVWRVKPRGDRAYMSVYFGGDIYGGGDASSDIRLLTSSDGYDWRPISERPQIDKVGAEEAEFEFDEEGNLVVVVREEVGGGSMVCTASKDDLSQWRTKFSPFKYDSSLMFRRGKDFYVIARRNLAGTFDRKLHALPESIQHAVNFAHYSLTRKRTTLYKVDVENLCLVPLFDFPSKGDTAFAGIAPVDDNRYCLFNYSSPLDGPDWPWLLGQLSPTRIYTSTLSFPAPKETVAGNF